MRRCCIWTASSAPSPAEENQRRLRQFARRRGSVAGRRAGAGRDAAFAHATGFPESDLAAHNYRILSRLTDGSVDVFVREGRSRFVFLQGHPEYTAETLGREYLRDMARFLKGEGARPAVPENYFDRVTENALQALAGRERQISDYNEVVTGAVPLQSWRSYTLRLFANWIASHRRGKVPPPGRADGARSPVCLKRSR